MRAPLRRLHDALRMSQARSASVLQAPIITYTHSTASCSAMPLPTGVLVVHAVQRYTLRPRLHDSAALVTYARQGKHYAIILVTRH